MVLGALVGVTLVAAIAGQQRFFRGASAITSLRSQLRQAAALLPMDLRPVSRRGGDIYSITSEQIDFRSVMGSSFICAKPTATTMVIPPIQVAKNNSLTAWINQPQVGDSMLVYDDSILVSTSDDAWRAYQITSITSVTGVNACPTRTASAGGFLETADATQPSYQITVSGTTPLRTSNYVGNPVRFFRRVKYGLYQDAADNNWYLGYADCAYLTGRGTNPCSTMRAVAGPLSAYSSSSSGLSTNGLNLQYFDSTGTAINPSSGGAAGKVARVRIALRAATDAAVHTPDAPNGTFVDSLVVHVGLRNRN
jgi:hypothetical protein